MALLNLKAEDKAREGERDRESFLSRLQRTAPTVEVEALRERQRLRRCTPLSPCVADGEVVNKVLMMQTRSRGTIKGHFPGETSSPPPGQLA